MDHTIGSIEEIFFVSFSTNKLLVDRLSFLCLEVILFVYSVRLQGYLLDMIFICFIMLDCNKVRERAG